METLIHAIDDPRLRPLRFDAADELSLAKLVPGFDVVVNGLPFKYDYIVNKVCVEHAVNGLDLSSDDPQFALHAEAHGKNMLFVPGVGATPGITNMLVRRAAEILDRMDEVAIHFAAFRCLAPAPGLLATTLWEFNPEEPSRQEVVFEGGTWHPSPPLTGEMAIRFHDTIGLQKVYYVPHDEAQTLPRSFPSLRRVAVRGCFPPQVMVLMTALLQAGLLTSRPVSIGEMEIPTIYALERILSDSPLAKRNEVWAYGLVVEVAGVRAGREVHCTFRSQHPPQEEWGGESAYFKNVGIPLSIGAYLIAKGQTTGVGVLPPEQAFPTQPFFSELARRGITIKETIVETGPINLT